MISAKKFPQPNNPKKQANSPKSCPTSTWKAMISAKIIILGKIIFSDHKINLNHAKAARIRAKMKPEAQDQSKILTLDGISKEKGQKPWIWDLSLNSDLVAFTQRKEESVLRLPKNNDFLQKWRRTDEDPSGQRSKTRAVGPRGKKPSSSRALLPPLEAKANLPISWWALWYFTLSVASPVGARIFASKG